MSVDLYLHKQKIHSVFELLGTKENDITYSLGWAMTQSPGLRTAFLRIVLPKAAPWTVKHISLQENLCEEGITDIELHGPELHAVVEAKRGWTLPTKDQLSKYAQRLKLPPKPHAILVTMSEASREFAKRQLPASIEGFRVVHLTWRDVQRMCRVQNGTHAEKRLLFELNTYFERIVKMQKQESNLVYVVSLGPPSIEVLEKHGCYWHPYDAPKWPKEPPNYLGFRYKGCLQSIHHVDAFKIVTNMREEIPEARPGEWKPHILYKLGPAIRPSKPVRAGRIVMNLRVTAMLDLLLTCDTISDARDLTRKRLAEDIESPFGRSS